MAWTGLNLTVEGRAALNKAQTDKHLNFKSIVVGDGNPPGNFSTVSRLVHQLYELTDLKIDTTDTGCMLIADLPDVDYDYYMREIGVIVITDDGEKLYVYDNCGSDAQYIVSTTGAEKTQKRIRLSLLVSDVKNITVSQPSILYVAYDDFENAVDELEKKKVDISGGDISDTVATLDETAGDAADNIASGESLRTILSKIYKVIRQFFDHKTDTVIHTTKADKDKLAGIEEHANNYVHPDTHPAGMITSDANHRFVTDDKIEAWNNSLSASKTYTDGMYRQATAYADKKVADLIGGAPESLDTLKEVADAIKKNESVMDALDAAVGKKANQSELDTHVDNDEIHITPQERKKWNDSVSKTGSISDTTVSFTQSSVRAKPSSGEKLSVIVGKIVKWLADLKTVAFSGSYKDLTNVPSTFPPAEHTHADIQEELDMHVDNDEIHITSQERKKWNDSVSKTGSISDTTVSFTQSSVRAKPSSGEKLSVIVGKIVKWLADLKTVAFSGSYNDLNNIPSTFNPAAHTHGGIDDGANSWTATEIRNHFEGKAEKVHTHTMAQITSSLGLGNSNTSTTWGTVKSDNGYTIRWGADQAGGGGISIGEKDGKTSIQIDGEMYVSEGLKRLARVEEIPSSLPANGGTSDYAFNIVGQYTGSGGRVPPSYVGANAVKCNMMNGFEGLNTPNLDAYMDVLMMNAYYWNDVPYATALGIKKGNGGVRAWIANGGNTSSWSQVAELLTSANYTEYAAAKGHSHAGINDGAHSWTATEIYDYIKDLQNKLSNNTLAIAWDGKNLRLSNYIGNDMVGYTLMSYNDNTFYSVAKITIFKNSDNILFSGEKGNFIVGVSVFSDARLKKNVKRSKLNAIECINEIEMCEYDFIDEKYGAHSELGYIAQQLQKVIPKCVVAVPQDKEQMGYDELLQVQDTHLIPYLVKAIQELSSKVAELEKKIDGRGEL